VHGAVLFLFVLGVVLYNGKCSAFQIKLFPQYVQILMILNIKHNQSDKIIKKIVNRSNSWSKETSFV